MIIRSLVIEDHPGIGNISLNFAGDDGFLFPVIILAGQNGTGKSSILEAIFNVFNGYPGGMDVGKVSLNVLLSNADRAALSRHVSTDVPEEVTIHHDSTIVDGWPGASKVHWTQRNGDIVERGIVMPQITPRLLCVFNEAGIDYNAVSPQTIGGMSLDNDATLERSSATANQIGQLLADIRAADSEDIHAWIEANDNLPPPDELKGPRIARFKAAFETMFPSKKFRGVTRTEGNIRVDFEEHGRISPINKLSTGEKQIVFRGGFLLQNQGKLADAVVMVDEPELSLHPDWQMRIVAFYREILKQQDGTHPQLIVATHSPYIVHGASGANVIILEKDANTGTISQSAHPVYPATVEAIAVRAFAIEKYVSATPKRLLVLTEGESDAIIIENAWNKRRLNQIPPFEIRAALGARNISITLNDAELPSKIGSKAVLGIFDYDREGHDRWNGTFKRSPVSGYDVDGLMKKHTSANAWAKLLPVPTHRHDLAGSRLRNKSVMAIEFLFEDRLIPTEMVTHEEFANSSFIPIFRESAKSEFASRTASFTADDFIHFEPILQAIEAILQELTTGG